MRIRERQRGSATVMALLILIFGVTVISGIMPMITTMMNNSPKYRDTIEAQYAAESGVKRAIVEFYQANQDWTWINISQDYIDATTANSAKSYTVSIANSVGTQVVPANPAGANTYTITSIGSVNSATKRATAIVIVPDGVGMDPSDINSPAHYTVYAGEKIVFNGGAAINGAPVTSPGPITGQSGSMVKPNAAGLAALPSFSAVSTYLDPARPVVNLASSVINTNYSGKTLIYNGDVTIAMNTNLNNVTIYATGKITIQDNNGNSGGQNINNSFIVSGANIDVKGGPGFSNTVILSYGNFTATGGTNLNGGSIMVAGSAVFNGNSNLNYSQNVVKKYLNGVGGGGTPIVQSWTSY